MSFRRLSIFLFLIILFLFCCYFLIPPFRSWAAVLYSQPYIDNDYNNGSARYVIKWTPDKDYFVKSISVGCYGSSYGLGEYDVYRVSDKAKVIEGDTSSWPLLVNGNDTDKYWAINSDTGYTFQFGESYYFTCGYGVNNGVYRRLKNISYVDDLSIGTIYLGLNNYSEASDVEPVIALCDTTGTCPFEEVINDTKTRIISVIPANATTTATSTAFTFGASIYVNQNDFTDGMRLKMRYFNNKNNLLVGPLVALSDDAKQDGSFLWGITSSGSSDYSTTTELLRKGKHFLTTEVQVPRFTLFGHSFFYKTIAATSTWFVVDEFTDFDIITGATSTSPLGYTTAGDYLFDKAKELAESFARRVPWGYGYRVYEILSSEVSPSNLPVLSITFPSYLPASGAHVEFDSWSPITQAIEYADSLSGVNFGPYFESGESLYDSFLRFWKFFWYLGFAFWLLKRLILSYRAGDFDVFESDDNQDDDIYYEYIDNKGRVIKKIKA